METIYVPAKPLRLTIDMLDAMNTALAELLAGEGPQAYSEADGQAMMLQADKAQAWVIREIARRKRQRKTKGG